jgi:hypothetical protein
MNLKKKIFTILLVLACFSAGIAQYADTANIYDYVRPTTSEVIKNANNNFITGLGIGGNYPYSGYSYSASPNILLGYERTVIHNAGLGEITLGAVFSYKQIVSYYQDYTTNYTYQQNWNYYMFGLRAVYYFTQLSLENFEPYIGFTEGYYLTGFKFSSTDPNYSNPDDVGYYLTPNTYPNFFAPGIFAGIRSSVGKRTIIWAELGYGYSTFAFGFSYKI